MTSNLQYEENEDEFKVKMLRKDTKKIGDILGSASEEVVLTYPKNYNFIKHLPQSNVNRLIKHGWDVNKTIFLEIPYVTTFYLNLTPSLAQFWSVCIPSKKIIFRILVFTRGYVSNADPIELEDTIIHESLHLSEDEPIYLKGGSKQGEYDETENRIEKIVKEKMFNKYGPKIIKIRNTTTKYAFNLQKQRETLFSGYLEYWINLYFTDKFDEYKQFAIKMDENPIHDGYITDTEKIYQEPSEGYSKMFKFKINPLISKST